MQSSLHRPAPAMSIGSRNCSLRAPVGQRLPALPQSTRSRRRCSLIASSAAPDRSNGRTVPNGSDRDTSARAAAELLTVTEQLSPREDTQSLEGLSYSQQYDILYKTQPLNIKAIVPKPNPEAQAQEPGATKVFLSDVYSVKKRPFFLRKWNATDIAYTAFLGGVHILACFAPFTFSWPMFWLFVASYFVTGCLGITLSYHRQLSHRSFQTPKWLEYVLAYCGVLAVQGDPLEWASTHRYHHLHTDTPLDPHSTYEGFWWSHLGWVLDNETTLERVYNRNNASDMEAQWYYRWLRDTYPWHVVAQFVALFALGGFPAVVWGGALRMVWVWHVTWFVNSASHVWGDQAYRTGDQSRNNWWVGLLAWGEGWHNNHHAFEFSARHGFEWWQVDVTWGVIWALQKVGLATNVKLPTDKQKARLAM